MQSTYKCEECQKSASDLCRKRNYCLFHRGWCFSCKKCDGQSVSTVDLVECSRCRKSINVNNSFYQPYCGTYLCHEELSSLDFSKDTAKLPCCDHFLDTQEFICFLSHFCITCGRKIKPENSLFLSECQICQKQQEKLKNEEEAEEKKEILEQGHILPSIAQEQSIGQNKVCIIELLRQDLQESRMRLQVSEFTRKQAQKIILSNQRDVECMVCLQKFDLEKKRPFLICIKQHLLCECCAKGSIVKECSICKTPIEKDKILPCRLKNQLILLERIITTKFKHKYAELLEEDRQQINNKIQQMGKKVEKVEEKVVEKTSNDLINKTIETNIFVEKKKLTETVIPKISQFQRAMMEVAETEDKKNKIKGQKKKQPIQKESIPRKRVDKKSKSFDLH